MTIITMSIITTIDRVENSTRGRGLWRPPRAAVDEQLVGDGEEAGVKKKNNNNSCMIKTIIIIIIIITIIVIMIKVLNRGGGDLNVLARPSTRNSWVMGKRPVSIKKIIVIIIVIIIIITT